MLSGLSFLLAFVFSINSLVVWLSIDLFHLKPISSPEQIYKIKSLFGLPFTAKRCAGSRLSWSLTICFSVALHSCVCSCPKISRNVFLKKVIIFQKGFLVVVLQSTCFICITWKRKILWNNNRTVHVNKRNQAKTNKKVTSYSGLSN